MLTRYRLTIEYTTLGDASQDAGNLIMALAETIVALSMKSLWRLADDPDLFKRHVSFADVNLEKISDGLDKPAPDQG